MTENEIKNNYKERVETAEKQINKNAITLRELLVAMEPETPLPDTWNIWEDIRPHSVYKVMLCFMSEEETWIECYRNHPILIPWYDCKVLGFNADRNYTLNIWLSYESFLHQKLNNSDKTWNDNTD